MHFARYFSFDSHVVEDIRLVGSRSSGRLFVFLFLAVVFSTALRWALATYSPNLYRPDEIFQGLEPAFRMWSGGGITTWEWREGIRSPIFPAFIEAIMVLGSKLGLSTLGCLSLIAGVFSLLSSGVVAVAILIGWRRFRFVGALTCGGLCALWPDLVYFGPKTLTEVQAGNLLTIAAFLAMRIRTGLRTAARRVMSLEGA